MSTTDEPTTPTSATSADGDTSTPQTPTAKVAPSAGFGLVFQAPDLSDVPKRKPRPRRATAPEGSESAVVTDTPAANDESGGKQRPRREDNSDNTPVEPSGSGSVTDRKSVV